MPQPDWPEGLRPYRRTPTFDQDAVPAGLRRAHSTRPGTWARLHVLDGTLDFRDLVSDEVFRLDAGIHALIHPGRLHEVVVTGPVHFFVEFCTLDATEAPAPPSEAPPDSLQAPTGPRGR